MVPGYNILHVVANNDVRAAGLLVSVYDGGTMIFHTGLRVITVNRFFYLMHLVLTSYRYLLDYQP